MHDVKPYLTPLPNGVFDKEDLSTAQDSPLFGGIHGVLQILNGHSFPMLHFNENHTFIPVHYYIDLSRSTPEISFDDMVAGRNEKLTGEIFPVVSFRFSCFALQEGPGS